MMLSERKNRYQVNHCIVQCKASKNMAKQLEGQKIGVSVSSGFPKPGSFEQFSCISANLNGGTCNIMGLLCSCLNVFFIVTPPELLPFLVLPTKLYFFIVILSLLVFAGLRF